MAAVMSRTRLSVLQREAPPLSAAWSIAIDGMALALAAALCFALWMTSTKVLLTADAREGGHVLACRYFTGAGRVERQYQYAAGGGVQQHCPILRRGG